MIKAAYRDGAFDPLLVPASISMELHRQASPEDGLEVTAGEPQRLPTAEGRVEGLGSARLIFRAGGVAGPAQQGDDCSTVSEVA